MYIFGVEEYYKDDNEADIIVSDGYYQLRCYVYPVKTISINQIVNCISGFACSDVVKIEHDNYDVIKLSQYYAYELHAKVVSRKKNVVKVGGLRIYLDTVIPKDICDNDYVSFSVMRLDAIL